ncbi:hypothetical protein SAMD00019534_077700, partial [Acytostelium subglobosum LB1]|uniref:hypothetical protein n=1 Tax=Acytostelium subglobosum LB1 TaxID=1410327 RepID=UPI000644AE3C
MVEIDILNSLERNGMTNQNFHCVRLLHWFRHKDHICLVFKRYGLSLYDFLKKNHNKPLPLSHIQRISKQLLTAIHTMHKISLIHTDLKPENILLENSNYTVSDTMMPIQCPDQAVPTSTTDNNSAGPARAESSKSRGDRVDGSEYYHLDQTDIVLIDFGGATFDYKHHTSVVCSRPYRPPEIILGYDWSYPCDLWGVGCILVELYIGSTLFDTHNNRQHLAMMEKVIGPLPQSMTIDSKKYYPGGDSCLHWKTDELDNKSIEKVYTLKQLNTYFHPDHNMFLDLASKLLEYHPAKRISAREALNHPFFTQNIINDLFCYR